ncbi:MAG: hypothetical protein K2X39_01530, partial [Silvanigrellaceae bacterium]|nr:hypothetical protein [Silvanigrellaceae bacterium]
MKKIIILNFLLLFLDSHFLNSGFQHYSKIANKNAFGGSLPILRDNNNSYVKVVALNSNEFIYLSPPSKNPIDIANFSISKLVLTFSVTLDSSNATGFTYNKNAWGLIFSDPSVSSGSSAGNQKYYTGFDVKSAGFGISIDDSGANFSQNGQQTGTIVVTFDFSSSNPQNMLPQSITNLINTYTDSQNPAITTQAIAITPYYDGGSTTAVGPNGSGSITGMSTFYWQQDIGAIAEAPSITNVAVQDETLVVSVSPPVNYFPAIIVDNALVTSSLNSTVTNYVLTYWDDSVCSNYGSWPFVYNSALWQAGGTAPPSNTPFDCSYSSLTDTLGCATNIFSSLFGLSENTFIIPQNIPTKTGLNNQVSSGCYNTVLFSAIDRSSIVIDGLENNHSYGLILWVTDSLSTDSRYPNGHLGLKPSEIVYATPLNIPLASSDEDLPASRRISKKSKADCFVVTAASGSVESPSVVYWRIIRDKYLDALGITPIYYRYAKQMASWLETKSEF